MVPDVDVAVVEGDKHPGLCWMYVDGLDSVGPGRKFALYIQFEWHC